MQRWKRVTGTRIRAPVAGLLLLLPFAPVELHAQTARPASAGGWTIDPERSLAWWQMDPNLGHLWASTCPDDPSWQAGEGRSPGFNYRVDPKIPQRRRVHNAKIPQWPRDTVRPVCRRAVEGRVAVEDAASWHGVQGTVLVAADSLTMGSHTRDRFMKKTLHTDSHPMLRFILDSLVRVEAGDTIRAVAVGTLEVNGATETVVAPVIAWREDGGLRVLAQFGVAARRMWDGYGLSRIALGLGVGLRIWNTLHMGVDLLLRPATQ